MVGFLYGASGFSQGLCLHLVPAVCLMLTCGDPGAEADPGGLTLGPLEGACSLCRHAPRSGAGAGPQASCLDVRCEHCPGRPSSDSSPTRGNESAQTRDSAPRALGGEVGTVALRAGSWASASPHPPS